MSLIGNTELLSTNCRVIGPHLAASGKSDGFPRVAAGTWCFLELQRGCPFESGVCSVKSGHLSSYEGQLRNVN